MKNKSRSKVMFVFTIAIITILFIGLLYLQIKSYNRDIKDHNSELSGYYANQINTIVSNYGVAAQVYFEEAVNNNEKVIDLVAAANDASDSEKKILRDELYDLLKTTYQNAITKNARQFHFHLKDCTSFLRLHKPESFGDSLEGIRDTVCTTRNTHARSFGFEEGRASNGYRFVFPLFKNDEYIGSVEMSYSPSVITKAVEEVRGSPGLFIIKKSVSDEKVFTDLTNTYCLDSDISNEYYYDKEVYEQLFGAENETANNLYCRLIAS